MIRVSGRFEIVIALLLVVGGIYIALVGATYGTGSLRRLGPGLFPLWLGWGLAGLSAVVAAGAFADRKRHVTLEARGFLWTLLGIFVFALLLETGGLLPATVLMVCCISMGNRSFKIGRELATAAGLVAFGYLLFARVLGVPVSLLNGWI